MADSSMSSLRICLRGYMVGSSTKSMFGTNRFGIGRTLDSWRDSSSWYSGVSLSFTATAEPVDHIRIFATIPSELSLLLSRNKDGQHYRARHVRHCRYMYADTSVPLARFSGILRGQESFAQAISFGLNTRDWYGGHVPLGVNTVLLGLAVYPTWLALREHQPVEVEGPSKGDDPESQKDANLPRDSEKVASPPAEL